MFKLDNEISTTMLAVLPLQLLGLFAILMYIPNIVLLLVYFLASSILWLYINRKKYKKHLRDHEAINSILESVITINDSMLKIENIEQLYQLMLEQAVDIIEDAQMGSLMILTQNNELEFKATVGFSFLDNIDIQIKLEDTFLWRESQGELKKPCIIKDVEKFNKNVIVSDLKEKIVNTDFVFANSTISAPIIINGMLHGMINVDNKEKNAFRERDLLLMEYFASQIGTVIQRHQLLKETIYLSQYDSLSNVLNRSYFEQVLDRKFNEVKKNNGLFTLVLFDLDNLKTTNDTYGHPVGDQLIKSFAKQISKVIEKDDLLARYGGDEFVSVFFNQTEKEVLEKINKVSNYLASNPLKVGRAEVNITFSYGVSSYPEDALVIKRLIFIADKKMYLDKERSRKIK